ncbi:hypothetical protein CJ030_MR3G009431 [Morella rubra]|uniref:Uncharacterized protein n=1 Tax=Morella rubra TaxID=262757 RepID=A0A6A1W5S4_9ROSI|nr:hypothetical protein CJ030_MR3G009431 [Morella rubra]
MDLITSEESHSRIIFCQPRREATFAPSPAATASPSRSHFNLLYHCLQHSTFPIPTNNSSNCKLLSNRNININLNKLCKWGFPNSLPIHYDANRDDAEHTRDNRDDVEHTRDPLSLPSGPITRLKAKRFKEALNGLIQESRVGTTKTKMGANNNQDLVHVIRASEE